MSAADLFTPRHEQDGNIVQELYHIEISMIRSIEENSFDPYTCRVRDLLPELACLDVASESTLSNTLRRPPDPRDTDGAVYFMSSGFDSSSTNMFGNSNLCPAGGPSEGKRIGDGMLDSFDVLVYLLHYFRIQPYDSLVENPSYVVTVQGEDDVDHRCQNEGDRTRYINFMAVNDACARPSLFGPRRLSEANVTYTNASSIDVYKYAQTGGGTWFVIRNIGIYLSLNFQLVNVDSVEPVNLNNAPVTPGMEPTDEGKYEVRFQRYVETVPSSVLPSQCARITGELAGAALLGKTLALSQYVAEGRPYLCAFDVFLYVPARSECDVYVGRGSRAIDGLNGVRTEATGRCLTVVPTPPSPPPSPPSPPPPPPPATLTSPPISPESPPPDPPTSPAAVVIAAILPVLIASSVGVSVYLKTSTRASSSTITNMPTQAASATVTNMPTQGASSTVTNIPAQGASSTVTNTPSQSASSTVTNMPAQRSR